MKRPMAAMALAACFGLSGVAMAAPAVAAPVAASAAAKAPTPAEVARYAEDLLARTYPADGPGAAVLVARGDQVLFRGARGMADVDGHAPLKPDSVFRLGSVTKQFAAAGLLTLVEAGKVKLDDPLSKYVPGYPGGDQITVLELLNHTSGIANYTAIPGYMAGPVQKDISTAQMIAVFRDRPVDFAPGTKWNYSNSGYVLVGAVIEAASGEPWHAYLARVLFKPLGMTHTGYGFDPKYAAMQVHGYTRGGGKVLPMMTLSMTQPHAAGALVSNVDDLLKWNRALHEGRVLKSALYRQMITPQGAAAQPAGPGYGFGLMTATVRGQAEVRHNGGIFGFATSLGYIQGPDITVAVLQNDDEGAGEESPDSLERKLMAAALGQPYPAAILVPVTAAALQAAEGVYRFDGDVVRVLRVVDGKLTAQRDKGRPQVLTPIAPDTFLYADGFSHLVLQRGADGKVSGMRFFPNGEGAGVVGARSAEPLPGPAVAVAVPHAALERLAGTYAKGEMELRVYLEGEALKAVLSGQPPVNLRANSPVLFDVVEAPATLEFSAGEGAAAQVTLRQGGRELVLPRKP